MGLYEREAADEAHWKRIERLLTRALAALGLLAVFVVGRIAYVDHRWVERCKDAGGVPVETSKCVRPGSFIDVPR